MIITNSDDDVVACAQCEAKSARSFDGVEKNMRSSSLGAEVDVRGPRARRGIRV